MRHRFYLAAIMVALGCGASLGTPTVSAQALVPHTVNLNFGNLEEQGISLARDAAQLAQFQQFDLALPRARLAVQLAPQSYQAQAVLGSLYLRKEEFNKAIAALTTAHNLKKDNPAVLFSLGSAYLRKGEYATAIKTLKTGLALSPKEPTAIFDLGNAYYMAKQYNEAIAEFKRVVDLDQKFWAATNNIGLVEYERGNTNEAVKTWEEALEQAKLTQDPAVEPRLALSVALFRKGEKERALKMAEEALNADPRYGKVEFLKENLWGERLLADTSEVLNSPKIQNLLKISNTDTRPAKQ